MMLPSSNSPGLIFPLSPRGAIVNDVIIYLASPRLQSIAITRIGTIIGGTKSRKVIMRLLKARSVRLIAGLIASLTIPTAVPAWADYLIHRGDVVELVVSGSPDLQRRAMVDLDGKVSFPLVGELSAAGLSLTQLRLRLRDLLIEKKALDNPDVIAQIVEYRPVYVAGNVDKPGVYPYRPGMTVRDAVAVAGGYGLRLERDRDMFVATFDARDEYDASSIELVRLKLRIARLGAEMAGQTDLDVKQLQTELVDAAIVSEFGKIEAQQLKVDQEDYDSQKAHLERLIKTTQDLISTLTQEEEHGREGLEQLQKDVSSAQQLLQKGLAAASRVEDEQRALSNAEWQQLETKSRIGAARKDLEGANRDLQKLPDQRRIDLIRELAKATSELAAARVRVDAAGGKLTYLRGRRRQPQNGAASDIAIFRKDEGEVRRIAASEDTDVLPGDAVEITQREEVVTLPATPALGRPPAAVPSRPLTQ
jgi:polysaccharide export outer membrane protein